MSQKSLSKEIFSFSQKNVDAAFATAKTHISLYGIKVLKGAPHSEQRHATFLLVPTRKIKRAVDRNRLKRRIKSIIYEQQLFKKDVASYIILLYPKALEYSFEEIRRFLMKV